MRQLSSTCTTSKREWLHRKGRGIMTVSESWANIPTLKELVSTIVSISPETGQLAGILSRFSDWPAGQCSMSAATPTGDRCIRNRRMLLSCIQRAPSPKDGSSRYNRILLPAPTGLITQGAPSLKRLQSQWNITVPACRAANSRERPEIVGCYCEISSHTTQNSYYQKLNK